MVRKVLSGRFSRVSATDYHDGVVLVGFCGNVWPHDLTPEQKIYLMDFFNMNTTNCRIPICQEWPEGVEPAYPAAKTNFKNGFLLMDSRK